MAAADAALGNPANPSLQSENKKSVPTVDWNSVLKWAGIILAVAGLGVGIMSLLNKDKGSKSKDSGSGTPCTKTAAEVIAKDVSCEGITCQNGGTCKNGSCNCPAGYYGSRCEYSSALGSGGTTIRNPDTALPDGAANDTLTAGGISDDAAAADAAAAREKTRNATAANYMKAKQNLLMGSQYPKTAKAVDNEIQGAETWRDSFGAVIEADQATYDESARFLTVLTDQANQITTDVVGSGRLIKIEEGGRGGAAAPAPSGAETEE
ncbi:MAG: calcium-binding EGF-like domain-containing protein [Alphaproteobacteria bacterium]|nr:calcium-binding EGF-like domain-containing protein [Alphaproteobacteria bacterium]